MGFQLFTTYLIILAAVSYSLYHFYKVIRPNKKTSLCGGCPSCDIKKELVKNKIKIDGLRMSEHSRK
ncbi:hypothetical protein EV201_0240 [Ancylomarina subtilis]|uniref:Attachment p12 family protein n=1 Tax=Ancylomarina subtilis TaxID=1639035 RepID=A0A4Q7VHN4_9BACT|nr:hypothetical protein [Ancylomarina subtilis]RZT95616.1 hypothetical protein EV201_0240 [Ancylomarina subtilis]